MHRSVRVCGVSVRAPVKGVRGKCSRRNYRLVACATPFTLGELRKMRKEGLVNELTKHDLDTKGTKAQLIERIQTHMTNQVPSLVQLSRLIQPQASESPPPEKDPLSGRTEKGLMRKKRTWLVEECEKRGLPTNGKKLTLIKRLQEYIEKKESMPAAEFKKAVDEMQNLVEENGINLKQRTVRIMQKLQSIEEQDLQKDIGKEQDDEKQDDEKEDEAEEQEDYIERSAEPVLADLANCIQGEIDLVSVVKYIGVSDVEKKTKSQLRGYFSPFVPELNKKSLRKHEMIELITTAYEQEVKHREKAEDELKTDQMAEMMAMDQLKLDTGIFIGDLDKSVDNLISEMKTEYGKHIPVEMEDPVNYLSEEELEELEKISEQEFSLETSVEDEVQFTNDEYPESPMGGPDVDERDLLNGKDELFQPDDDEVAKFVSGTRQRHDERQTEFEEARKNAFLQFEKFIEENKVDLKVETAEFQEQDSEETELTEVEESPVLDEMESPVLEDKTEAECKHCKETTQSAVLEEKDSPVLEESETTVEAEEDTEVEESPVLDEQETVLAEQDTTALITDPDVSIPDTLMEAQEIPKADFKDTPEKLDTVLASTEPVLEEDTVLAEKPEPIGETVDPVVKETEEEITIIETADPVVSKMDAFALKEAAEKIFATHARKELLEMSEEAFLDIVKPLNMDINPIRTEFITRLAELAEQDLSETDQKEDNLVELSLSQMNDEPSIVEVQDEIKEDEWVSFQSGGFFDERKDTLGYDDDDYDDSGSDTEEVWEEKIEQTRVKMTMTSIPKMDDLDNLNTPKITQVLNELRSQRSEWEDTTKDLLQFLQEKCDAEQQPQKKADLMKGIEALTEEYEDLKDRVNEKDEEVVELQSKINRVILEFDLLSPDVIIGDGNGEFGPLTTYSVDSFADLMSLNSNDDDFSLNYHLDTDIQDSTVVFDPSDPQIQDQLNSNFNAAADSELFLRNSSDEEDLDRPPKEEPLKTDLMKKHSSIAVTLAAGISEVWKNFFKTMEPKKE